MTNQMGYLHSWIYILCVFFAEREYMEQLVNDDIFGGVGCTVPLRPIHTKGDIG